MVKKLPAMQETQVRSLGWEDPLEKEMATRSSILTWEIPWTEKPLGYSPWGCKRVRHDLATKQLYIYILAIIKTQYFSKMAFLRNLPLS